MKKIIFFDVDGTLIDENNYIPASTIQAVYTARKNGVVCIVNTGRPFCQVEPKVVDIGFDGYICSCGQHVILDGKDVIHVRPDPVTMAEMKKLCDACGMGTIYEGGERTSYYAFYRGMPEEIYNDKVRFESYGHLSLPAPDGPFQVDKFCAYYYPDSDLERFHKGVEGKFTTIDRGAFLECVVKGYTKATGMKLILDTLGILPENSYGIGDSMNDLPMLKEVAHPIAMGNTDPRLLPYVEYRTERLAKDGIAKALKHYGLI